MELKPIRPIHSESDYRKALAEVERLMSVELDDEGEDHFDVLATLVEAYEKEHHDLGPSPDPIRAIKAHMDNAGLQQKDLAELLGSRSRASELLSHRQTLSITMIRKLVQAWGLPADLLIREIPIKGAARRTQGRKVSQALVARRRDDARASKKK